jgi:hypothetical protein
MTPTKRRTLSDEASLQKLGRINKDIKAGFHGETTRRAKRMKVSLAPINLQGRTHVDNQAGQ